ncbi:MAG TPA: hypothetical protein PLQ76_08535, partial [bacterium]|nr:hypothetical protein [bacterium]
MKTGVYVETLEPEILIEQDVKGILAEFGCDVGMGFDLPYGGISGERAAYYDRYLRAMDVLRESGVRLFLWPLARKNDGYWLNEKNVDVFSAGLESFSEYAQRAGVGVPGFIYDIETPWNQGTVFTAAAKKSDRR